MLKICTTCDKEKDLTEFYKNKNTRDGLSYTCKICVKQYKEANKDKINEKRRIYFHNHKDEMKTQQHINYIKHKDIRNKKCSEYYFLNKSKINEKDKKYRENNKQSILLRNRLRKLSMQGNVINQSDINNILQQHDFCCHYCHISLITVQMHLDHKVPLSRGGTNDITNLVPSCKSCNLRKGTKTDQEFMLKEGNYVH